MNNLSEIDKYLDALKDLNTTGVATEHSFRGPLETLINSLDKRFIAINEPKRQACGAPDYVVKYNSQSKLFSIGYIEAKDIWVSLDKIEKTEQFKRYINSLDNLILTNYIEFRRYIRGVNVSSVVIGTCNNAKNLVLHSGRENELESFLQDFLSFPIKPVTSAQELAECMARLTHAIREIVLSSLDSKSNKGVNAWREAFAKTLIPDLLEEKRKSDFADMYAQTIAYGFFAARCHHDANKGDFARHTAQEDIPKTNPLLRSLFVSLTGPELKDEPYYQFVEDLIHVLSLSDIDSILKDFGKHDKKNDPIIHFYETFLSAYDPKLREKRGIYYTPEPVVSWLIRAADSVVRNKFHISQGLADSSQKINIFKNGKKVSTIPKVLILDPACGTGTFLYKTIELIRERLIEQKQEGMWSSFVRDSLLPRIFGFELLMAPYAIAHFKLSLQLAGYDLPNDEHNSWHYDFSGNERLNIYLTNTLDEIQKDLQINLPGFMQVLSEEGQMAREIKQSLPILVIMGNPPYSGESANASTVRVPTGKYLNGKPTYKTKQTKIGMLIQDYKFINGESICEKNVKWLQDDYVKFIRWAQWKLEKTNDGVVTFVTNHGYLDNPTFRGMRYSLLHSFDEIYIYDLHGNSRKKEKAPDGSPDQNVFDILQGVSMCVLVKYKNNDNSSQAKLFHAEMYGSRENKYKLLFDSNIENTKWTELTPKAPNYLFIPQLSDEYKEYESFISLNEIFKQHSNGIVTARDKLTIHYTFDEIFNTINEFNNMSSEDARIKFSLGEDSRDWKVALAQADIKESGLDEQKIVKILYRPFDIRYTYYTGKTKGFMCMPRSKVMNNMINIEGNIGIITSRLTKGEDFSHIQATQYISEAICLSSKTSNNGFLFPLYIEINNKKSLNIKKDIINLFKNIVHIQSNDDIFYYIYAVLNTPLYQNNYKDFLRYDFPRVPIPHDEMFENFVNIGKTLIDLYTLRSVILEDHSKWITQFTEVGTNIIEDISYSESRIYINSKQFFAGISKDILDFTVGSYQPAMKWIKDRKGRKLTFDDIQTYQKIILSISEIIKLKHELDDIWQTLKFN